jgi:ribonucleoside-diphosphate reductase beta chain
MKKSIITQEPSEKQPMFFGTGLGLKRYDKYTHVRIANFYKQQLEYYWRPGEVDLAAKEQVDYKNLSDVKKFVFLGTLSYNILLDSVQTHGVNLIRKYASLSEIESFCIWWEAFEDLHSQSYTHIIENVFPNPEIVFDEIMNNEEVLKRASSVTKYYDNLLNALPEDDIDSLKKKLYLTLVSVNILEGVRFYVSFACAYAMAENGEMEGNAKIISLINRDENLHLGFTQYVLRTLRKDPFEGFLHIVEECEPLVYQMYEDAVAEESEWCKYLFSKGSFLGLNETDLNQYMKYLTNIRMNAIGLKPFYEGIENPLSWMENWTSSKSVQVAPQETEISSYLVGALKQDVSDSDFMDFDLG